MTARTFAAWSASALTISLATANPVYRALVVLSALNVLIAWRRPGTRLRPLLLAIAVAALIATLITLAVSHTGADALLRLPSGIPVLGGALTLEALVFGLTSGLGIAAAVLAAAPLSLAVEPNQLIDALPRQLSRTGAVVGTALNLIPGLSRSAAEIRDGQRMRGWRAGRVSEWPDLAVPVVLTALEHSMQLAEAMEARGFGSGDRTSFAPDRTTPAAWLAAALAVAGAAAFLVLRLTGALGDWYPFPDVTAPPVDPLGLACCLALLAPLLVPRR